MSDFIMIILSVLIWINLTIAIVQIFGGLYRFFFGKDKYPGYKDKLAIYLTCVIFYFLLLKLFWEIFDVERNMNSYEGTLVVYTLIVPLPLAAYYWKIVYHTKK